MTSRAALGSREVAFSDTTRRRGRRQPSGPALRRVRVDARVGYAATPRISLFFHGLDVPRPTLRRRWKLVLDMPWFGDCPAPCGRALAGLGDGPFARLGRA